MSTGPQRAEATELSRPKEAPVPMGPDAPLMEVLATMRAMRRLKPDPVPEELLTELVRAATWAPSASDAQHYGFVVVTDRDRMAELSELWRSCYSTYTELMGTMVPDTDDDRHRRMRAALDEQAERFDQTPALVAACYRRSSADRAGLADPRAVIDLTRRLGARDLGRLLGAGTSAANLTEASSIYPACQNLLLAARAHGLAATLTVWHLFRARDWQKALGVPKELGIYALIPIGWPKGNFGPVRRRPVEEVLHWQTW